MVPLRARHADPPHLPPSQAPPSLTPKPDPHQGQESPFFYNYDQWDGYVAARNRLLRTLVDREVTNPMVLSGDIHLAVAGSVRLDYDDPAAPDIANEVVTTSITSRFQEEFLELFDAAFARADWARYGNARQRGYALITLTTETWTTDFRVVDVKVPQAPVSTDHTDVVAARAPVVVPPGTPTPETPTPPVDPGNPGAPGGPGAPSGAGGPGRAPGATPVSGNPNFTG